MSATKRTAKSKTNRTLTKIITKPVLWHKVNKKKKSLFVAQTDKNNEHFSYSSSHRVSPVEILTTAIEVESAMKSVSVTPKAFTKDRHSGGASRIV